MGERGGGLGRGADIADRLVRVAVEVFRICRTPRRDSAGRHVVGQLVRSSTSAGANYEEARAAESRADFIHKCGVAAKELRETSYWLGLIAAAALTPVTIDPVRAEVGELAAILAASIRTARRNAP